MVKKNPFKIWGSYVGAMIVSAYFIFSAISITLFCGGLCPEGEFGGNALVQLLFFIAMPTSIIIGFLSGWGIHSWIRKARS